MDAGITYVLQGDDHEGYERMNDQLQGAGWVLTPSRTWVKGFEPDAFEQMSGPVPAGPVHEDVQACAKAAGVLLKTLKIKKIPGGRGGEV